MQISVGIIGSGNIGADLMYKVLRRPELRLVGLAGIDPASEGLARARELGVTVTDKGLEHLLTIAPTLAVVFDATSAAAHRVHAPLLAQRGIRCIDLTPAALGPAIVPDVNLHEHVDAPEVNLITCGAQAAVPIVAALSSLTVVPYAEMVSTISSKSAGPGTRANIDEFTLATARSLEVVGGAQQGKALIVLNPAEPPIMMRNTIYVLAPGIDRRSAEEAISHAVQRVSRYVPGYRLATDVLFDGERVTVIIEVTGAGDYLPPFAGNLDIMTSAAVRVAEMYAARLSAV